jgi:hypothetical protein
MKGKKNIATFKRANKYYFFKKEKEKTIIE